MDYQTSPTFDGRQDVSHSHFCQSRSSTSSTSSSSSYCKVSSPYLNSSGSSVRHSSTSSSESSGAPARCSCREVRSPCREVRSEVRSPSPSLVKPVLRKGEAVDIADIEGERETVYFSYDVITKKLILRGC